MVTSITSFQYVPREYILSANAIVIISLVRAPDQNKGVTKVDLRRISIHTRRNVRNRRE